MAKTIGELKDSVLRADESTWFTVGDKEKLEEIHATVMELRELIKTVEPFLDSFMGSGGASKSPMNMILGSLMGGGR